MKNVNASARPKPTFHQVYGNGRGTDFVSCDMVSDRRLINMALGADAIQVWQEWPKILSEAEISRFRMPFTELFLFGDPIDEDPEGAGPLVRWKLEWDIHLLREEFKSRYDRHVLAGRAMCGVDGARRDLLLVVLAPTHVTSCEWQLPS